MGLECERWVPGDFTNWDVQQIGAKDNDLSRPHLRCGFASETLQKLPQFGLVNQNSLLSPDWMKWGKIQIAQGRKDVWIELDLRSWHSRNSSFDDIVRVSRQNWFASLLHSSYVYAQWQPLGWPCHLPINQTHQLFLKQGFYGFSFEQDQVCTERVDNVAI